MIAMNYIGVRMKNLRKLKRVQKGICAFMNNGMLTTLVQREGMSFQQMIL